MRARWPILLAAASGCGLFNGPKPPEGPPASSCEAPADPALLGIAPDLRNAVLEAAEAGVVVVRYRTDGCAAELAVEKGCRISSAYRYAAIADRKSTIIRDEVELFLELPLHGGGLTRALEQYGALRVDEEVVGRLEAPESLSVHPGALSGECERATHVAVAIDLGGASLVAGSMPAVTTERNWFLRPDRKEAEPAALQYLGRVGTCRKAHTKGRRTPGCDHPLRVRLRPIRAVEEKTPEPPPPAPPPPAEKPKMIAIPAGEFRMGHPKATSGDGPEHPVELEGFEIDRTEVTAADYASCVAAGSCTAAGSGRFCTGGVAGKEDHPINCVTWKQAAAYCAFATKRLPTEAEWERAARGTDGRRFAWGDQWPPPPGSGNFADRAGRQSEPEWHAIDGYDDGHPHTAPVGSGEVASLAGNVQEWVSDWYDPRAYSKKKRRAPSGPSGGKARVVRGASFGRALPEELEVTRRFYYFEDFESAHVGFRCAR